MKWLGQNVPAHFLSALLQSPASFTCIALRAKFAELKMLSEYATTGTYLLSTSSFHLQMIYQGFQLHLRTGQKNIQ